MIADNVPRTMLKEDLRKVLCDNQYIWFAAPQDLSACPIAVRAKAEALYQREHRFKRNVDALTRLVMLTIDDHVSI